MLASFAGWRPSSIGADLVAGVFRLGFIADLLSIPITTGFLAGIAIHILASQAPALLAVSAPGVR